MVRKARLLIQIPKKTKSKMRRNRRSLRIKKIRRSARAVVKTVRRRNIIRRRRRRGGEKKKKRKKRVTAVATMTQTKPRTGHRVVGIAIATII